MKKIFNACVMCFSMFCAIPSPFRIWDEEARPLMTLFLPLVGAFIGALWSLTAYIARILNLPALVAGAVLCCFPFIITGGMHMDGFLDVTDAVKSWRDIEQRRKILKDPNVGSFAVIAGILVVMTQFALLSSVRYDADLLALILIPTVSRAVAGICVTVLRPLSTSEYSGAYRKGVRLPHVVILSAVLAAAVTLGFILLGRYGWVSIAVIAGYLLNLQRAFRSLDGMSGDISGYALVFGELCGVAVFALI